ncbi:MAG: thioredoxin-disulfide reductase [Candidatus Omnitrophica bacterium]|nr:thioredoxin-disulfide reductase [Candidatus Omnitrophota bacterium]
MAENFVDKDIVIIGAGPAGLTAAIYARRAGLNLIILEDKLAGGQLNLTSIIENYPGFPGGIGGGELAEKMKEQANAAGVEIVNVRANAISEESGMFFVTASKETYRAKTVIIATGAVPKRLGIKGEEELTGKGVSFCAVCDAPLYKDKVIAAVGGGDTALEEALFLSRFAVKVYLIHRRDEFRAARILVKRIKDNKKIEVLHSYIPLEVTGGTRVEGVKLQSKKDGSIKEISINGLFVFVGSEPQARIIKDLVETDKDGFIITDENMRAGKKGIFAAGDVRKKKIRQVVLACSEGAQAALSAAGYLKDGAEL